MLTWISVMINKKLSAKYGWVPRWFHSKHFDKSLVKEIKTFQRNNGLFPSGWCGKKTYRQALFKILLRIKQRNNKKW
jgi:murein L,D-transpeptidase YcbB/YkuD